MPRHLHLDFETFSEADLKSVGAYRYAYDPSTEILCAAMALGQGPTVAWWQDMPDRQTVCLEPYWDALEDPTVLIYAHNAMFEMAICQALLQKTWNIPCPSLDRFRCTMSLARRAALPAGLDKLAVALKLTNLKDARGKTLLRKFSVMQKAKAATKKFPEGLPPRRILPSDEPAAFAELIEYCRQDVRVEQDVAEKLRYFDEPINNANYSLDARINARGVTVNVGALEHAQKLIEEETEVVSAAFKELTGVNVTQRAKVLEWVNNQLPQPLPNLQAETIESFLEEIEDEESCFGFIDPVNALVMKQSIAYASVKKVATMLACVGPHDNRIRGMLNHHGTTPGRWTSSLVQFQNVKRSTLKSSEEAYADICNGISREMLDLCYGPPLEVISSCVRHFVQDTPCLTCNGCGIIYYGEEDGGICDDCGGDGTRMFNDVDYAAIQARIVAWLAGQEDVVDQYRRYDAAQTKEEKHALDPYRLLAVSIYGLPLNQIEKFPHRHVGKHARLGLGFQMAAPKFRVTVKKQGNYDLPLGMEDTAVSIFRATNKHIVRFWYDTDRAAKRAIVKPGTAFASRRITFLCRDVAGIPFLLMKLPSGRKIAYPHPRVVNDRIIFFGNIIGSTWGDVDTYGGKLVENATMGVEADILFHGLHNAENAGYEIATLIHDQALAYHKPGQTPEEFVELLTDLPSWADGLPIAAEGALVKFYKKD